LQGQFFHQLVEGVQLVGVGLQAGGFDLCEQLCKAVLCLQAGAQREGVDEKADLLFQVEVLLPATGRADDQVCWPE
jgi:hypothetical protein